MSATLTFFAVAPARFAIDPVTVKLLPPRAGDGASLVNPSIATSLGTAGLPQIFEVQDGALFMVIGTPPRTVPMLVSETCSSPLPGPPLLVTAIASVLRPSGFSTPLGITKVCCGPTFAMYWPMFQPLTKISAR